MSMQIPPSSQNFVHLLNENIDQAVLNRQLVQIAVKGMQAIQQLQQDVNGLQQKENELENQVVVLTQRAEKSEAAMIDANHEQVEKEMRTQTLMVGAFAGGLLGTALGPVGATIGAAVGQAVAARITCDLIGSYIPYGPKELAVVTFMHEHPELTKEEALIQLLREQALNHLLGIAGVTQDPDDPHTIIATAQYASAGQKTYLLRAVVEGDIVSYLQNNPDVSRETAIREIAKKRYAGVQQDIVWFQFVNSDEFHEEPSVVPSDFPSDFSF